MRLVSLILFLSFTLSIHSQEINRSYLAYANQSSTHSSGSADKAVDGNSNGQWSNGSVTHTLTTEDPWWQCDMGESVDITHIGIWNRTDCCTERLQNFYVFVSDMPFGQRTLDELLDDTGLWFSHQTGIPDPSVDIDTNISGRYVRIQLDNLGDTPLSLAEVEVWAMDTGKSTQTIDFVPVPKKRTDSPVFDLMASADSGLPVNFTVLEGPASVDGTQISLEGTPGTVVIQAEQAGDADYYAAAPMQQEFEVVDPATVIPTSRIVSLSDAYPIYMPQLKPIQLFANGKIEHSDLFQISDFYFDVNGNRLDASMEDGLYTAWWEPSGYQNYNIQAVIVGSNGLENRDQLIIEVSQDTPDLLVSSFKNEHVSPSAQFITKSFNFPSQVGAFFDIIAILDIRCPPGGCDPWDRLAWIEVRWPDGEWREIIRYITPFGVPCQHIIDVSEYAALLQGEVEFRVYISTWQAGFEVTLDFAFTAGTPPFSYSKVNELWQGAYDFGNIANLQPLDSVSFDFHPKAEKAELNVLISGHGWGDNNAENAAEFRYTRNYLHADDMEFEHVVYNICDPNPDGCQPQGGTWRFSRSGWCPGAITHPIRFDLNPFIGESNVEMIYELDPLYVDWCHPNHPACVDGVTCEDCNAGFNPHYYISGNLVQYSNEPMTDNVVGGLNEPEFGSNHPAIFPNPGSGIYKIQWDEPQTLSRIQVFDSMGKLILIEDYQDKKQLSFSLDLSTYLPGIFYLQLLTPEKSHYVPVIKI